ncbi:hypothetical protein FGO68_gene3034 [Halteria grandinella]|uniref:Uncharacterized protein n=1 Tax=Halteria grandinella TaxID=5974 RepID=A0A8J8T3T2_HALGN|nr:hypothetical protein FGO68_gene3034 [Halteria grandinella]
MATHRDSWFFLLHTFYKLLHSHDFSIQPKKAHIQFVLAQKGGRLHSRQPIYSKGLCFIRCTTAYLNCDLYQQRKDFMLSK